MHAKMDDAGLGHRQVASFLSLLTTARGAAIWHLARRHFFFGWLSARRRHITAGGGGVGRCNAMQDAGWGKQSMHLVIRQLLTFTSRKQQIQVCMQSAGKSTIKTDPCPPWVSLSLPLPLVDFLIASHSKYYQQRHLSLCITHFSLTTKYW